MISRFALLPFALGALMSPVQHDTPPDPLPRWLVGCWEHGVGRTQSAQRWTAVGPNTLFGVAWTASGDSLVALIVMRLAAADDSLALDLIPASGPPESLTGHALPAEGAAAVAFEPIDGTTRIQLRPLPGDHALQRNERAEGPATALDERRFRRVPCSALLHPAGDETPAMARLHRADERAVVAGDADALERLWTDDIVALAPGTPPRAGRAANAAAMRRTLAQSQDLITLAYRLRVAETHRIGDHAIEWGRYEARVRARTDTTIARAGGAMLRVIRRGPDGRWRVARTMFTAD